MTYVALFLPDLSGGGAERVMLLIAKHLSEAGHKVDFVLARREGALLDEVPESVRLIDLRAGLRSLGAPALAVTATVRLTAYLRRSQPDTLMCTLTGANLAGALATRLSRCPLRLVLREAVTLANVRSGFRLRLMRVLYPVADKVVALTEVSRKELVEVLGIPPKQVTCIPNPVDVGRIRVQAEKPIEHPWVTQSAQPLIVAAGRLTRQKDFATLIRAFAALRKELDVRLAILGEGPERERLHALAVELNVGDHLLMPGFDHNPYRWLSRASVVAISSRWEGSPNVLVEALALGKQIVITEYDSSVFDYRHMPGVTLVPLDDLASMVSGLSAALRGPRSGRYERTAGTNALSDRGEQFSVYRTIDHYSRILVES